MLWDIDNVLNKILSFLGVNFSLSFLSVIYFIKKQQQLEQEGEGKDQKINTSFLYSIHNNVNLQRNWIYNKYQSKDSKWIVSLNQAVYGHIEAAKDGNITALTWLLIHELEWNSSSFSSSTSSSITTSPSFDMLEWIKLISTIAISHNHINILLWIDQSGYEFNFNEYFNCSDAVILGHFHVALWLKEKCCAWENRKGYLLTEAIESNNQELFDWLINYQKPLPKVSKLCTTVIQNGRWEMLHRLLKLSFPIEEQALLYLIEHNEITRLETIRSYKPIPISERCFDLCVSLGNYDLLSYFRGCTPFCVENDHLNHLQKYQVIR